MPIIMRFYWLDQDDHIRAPSEEVECADDADALDKAAEKIKAAQNAAAIEVWDRARRVGKVTASAAGAGQASPPAGQPQVPANRAKRRLWGALPIHRVWAAVFP